MKLKTIIVEDEIFGQEALSGILSQYCEETVDVIDQVEAVDQAVFSIKKNNPHLVFLDIKLCGNTNGAFDVLNAFKSFDFSIVFTTSSNQPESILRALNQYGVKKYLLKPLSIDEVIDSVKMAMAEWESKSLESEIHEIKKIISTFSSAVHRDKFRVPVKQGFRCIKYDEIIMLRSNANHTYLFLTSDENMENSKNLKYFEAELPADAFVRVSKSYIINLNHVVSYTKENGGTIYLTNNCAAPLSDRYSKGFFQGMK
jgi:two-component system, LytTR family, response regulator